MASTRPPYREYEFQTAQRRLRNIYTEHVQGTAARGRDGINPNALASEIDEVTKFVSHRLRDGRYRFTSYRELVAPKGATRLPRVLSIPTARDRIALRALTAFLSEVFPERRTSLPHVHVRRVTDTLQTGKFDSFLRLDVKEFYPSISHDLIRQELGRKISKAKIIDTIMRAVSTPTTPASGKPGRINRRGVPQGLSISNSLAELAMTGVDSVLAGDTRCVYIRYVDDILVLCQRSDVRTIHEELVAALGDRQLEAHPLSSAGSKSTFGQLGEPFEYLGYRFDADTVSVRESSVRKIEESVARVLTRHKYAHSRGGGSSRTLRRRLDLAITGCIYEGNPFGWLHYYRQLNDLELLAQLDNTVSAIKRRTHAPRSLQTKTFVRAYWAIRTPGGRDGKYIPRFDNLSLDEMREVLIDLIGEEKVYLLSDDEIPARFKRHMRNLTDELERDIGPLS